jgi:hypothetical protein
MAVAALGAILFVASAVLPALLRNMSCPAGTFLSGPMGPQMGVLIAILVPIVCVALLLAIVPRAARPFLPQLYIRHHLRIWVTVSVLSLLTLMGALAKLSLSYFCATPLAVFVHPDVLRPSRAFLWSDVRSVHARCWVSASVRRRSGHASVLRFAGLDIEFADGEEVSMTLGGGAYFRGFQATLHDFDMVKLSLFQQHYSYQLTDLKYCPAKIYSLFAGWPEDQTPTSY